MARAASRDIEVLGSRRKAKLEAIVRRPSSPQALVRRARIVLLAHAGWPNAQIAARLGCAPGTVRTWRRRFARGGMPALSDRPRSGRPEIPRLSIHLVMDNGSSHTSRATRAWIAAHPPITVTYTPKHASWLDMAEIWFSALTRGLLRRGEFTSRADLAAKITSFTTRYNRTAKPWTWTYDARADHTRYRARRSSQHPAAATEPATIQTLRLGYGTTPLR